MSICKAEDVGVGGRHSISDRLISKPANPKGWINILSKTLRLFR